MAGQDLDDGLFAEALRLLDEVRDTQSNEALNVLREWRTRSDEHGRAVAAAEQYAELTRSAAAVRFSKRQRMQIALQTWAAKIHERRLGLATVGVTATAILGFAVFLLQADPGEGNTKTAQPSISLESARHANRGLAARRVRLPDDSIMWLGARTVVDAEFGPGVRRIHMVRGRAAFQVRSDPNAPFTVEAGDVLSQVTGTEFTVGYLDGRNSVEVAVIEGSVHVSTAESAPVPLGPETAVRSRAGVLGEIARRPVNEIGSWRDGVLVFRNRPLIEAIEVIEPYTSYRIDTSRLYSLGREVSGTYLTERADAGLISILEAHRLALTQEPPNTLILAEPAILPPTGR